MTQTDSGRWHKMTAEGNSWWQSERSVNSKKGYEGTFIILTFHVNNYGIFLWPRKLNIWGQFFNPDRDWTPTAEMYVCLFICLFVCYGFLKTLRWVHQTSTSENLLLSMLWSGKAASNSVMRKTTGLSSITPTYNLPKMVF